MDTFEDDDDQLDNYLEHIGIKRRSGRYPWGSGDTPYQRSKDFKSLVEEMKAKGMTEGQMTEHIAAFVKANGGHDFKTPDFRAAISGSTEIINMENRAVALQMKRANMSTSAIAREMSTPERTINESTVRGWLKDTEAVKAGSLQATSDMLKTQLETKPFLDVGKGNHLFMGISDLKLRTALALMEDEGYHVWTIKQPQLGNDKQTTLRVLVKEGVSWNETRLAVNEGKLRTIAAQSDDGGQTFRTPKAGVESISSKRVAVKWKEDGGSQMDGVIELRRGVADLDLGANKYAQVRIAVDGKHYLKGMAMYADDMPAGVDIRFNTNKPKSDDITSAMKPMKNDPSNPFGATTHPAFYKGKDGKDKTSILNLVNEEGDWDRWSRSLSSQMLSKQSVPLAAAQLKLAKQQREDEFAKLQRLTNPVVKRKLMEEFADSSDAAAVHLKAAAMPRQQTKVILPMNNMRPHEIYAPDFTPGEKVTLVRHPHGGPFEIPELTVNNSSSIAKRLIGGAKDAVGIHWSVAEQLSGADFDGDSVIVIPNDSRKIRNRPPLQGLRNFDAKAEYKIPDSDKTTTRMTKKSTQTEMGKISNLITDMSIKGATDGELARAVRHSMVVIDAEKHGLDYKQSAKDNNIAQLKDRYQGGARKGSATLISRSSSDARIPQRKALFGDKGIDPKTGERLYVTTGKTYEKRVLDKDGNPTGETKLTGNITKGTRMEFAKDARELLSGDPFLPFSERGTPMERTYADYANSMKALGNRARKEYVAIESPRQSPAAKKAYASEVQSLTAKLRVAQQNAPLERRAQNLAGKMAKDKIDANPQYDKDDIKRAKYQALEDARIITGANKKRLGAPGTPQDITPREWEAIQSRAVSATTLREILANADMDRIRDLATPRARTSLTPGQMARAKQMESQGRSLSEIADQLGLPRSTISDNLKAE